MQCRLGWVLRDRAGGWGDRQGTGERWAGYTVSWGMHLHTLYIHTDTTYHHPSPTTVYFCFEDLIKVSKHYITTIWKSKNSRFTAAISRPVMYEVLLSIVGFILSLVEDNDLDQLGDLLLLAYDNLFKRKQDLKDTHLDTFSLAKE